MENWFELYRDIDQAIKPGDIEQALKAYVHLHIGFVRIHPFFDGNGRLARLVANIPVLKAGLPPIIILREQRKEDIDALSAYYFAVGQIRAGDELMLEPDKLQPFTELCRQAWQASIDMVDEAQKKQQDRQE